MRRVNPQAVARLAGGAAVVGQLLVVAADRAAAWAKGYERGYAACLEETAGAVAPEEGAMFAFASRQLREMGHDPELVIDDAAQAPRFRCTRCGCSWEPNDNVARCEVVDAVADDVTDPSSSAPPAEDGG